MKSSSKNVYQNILLPNANSAVFSSKKFRIYAWNLKAVGLWDRMPVHIPPPSPGKSLSRCAWITASVYKN